MARGAAVLLAAVLTACRPAAPEAGEPALSITELLGGSDTGSFARAVAPREFRFPEDHGPHPEFRTEWWYFTGNLAAAGNGGRFGYQLTFFRSALAADVPPRESAWATRDAWMAHFAITEAANGADGAEGRFRSFERFARGAAGLAGARVRPFRVWLEDWSAEGGDELLPLRLRAAADGAALDLTLEPGKPPVLQGEAGLSRKGATPGNASYYYSLTRLPTAGQIILGGVETEIEGLSWMDREWSTSALEEGVVGWDWFSLQLDDGRELMFYRLRRADGTADPASAGSLVAEDGSARTLGAGAVELAELDRWRSPQTGRSYPSRWRLAVPVAGLELGIEPLVAAQELAHSFDYWEGAVRAGGLAGGEPVAGRGYVELTGYE